MNEKRDDSRTHLNFLLIITSNTSSSGKIILNDSKPSAPVYLTKLSPFPRAIKPVIPFTRLDL